MRESNTVYIYISFSRSVAHVLFSLLVWGGSEERTCGQQDRHDHEDPDSFERQRYASVLLRQLYLGPTLAIGMPQARLSVGEKPIENRAFCVPFSDRIR